MIIELERTGNRVFHNGIELKINPQTTKGPNKEVIDVEKVAGSDWQKWVSLSKLTEGINEIELKPRKAISHYQFTKDEAEEIGRLEARIREIKEAAGARKPIVRKKPEDMSAEELMEYLEYLNELKSNLK